MRSLSFIEMLNIHIHIARPSALSQKTQNITVKCEESVR